MPELKAKLVEFGLDATGLKDTLIDRLAQHMAASDTGMTDTALMAASDTGTAPPPLEAAIDHAVASLPPVPVMDAAMADDVAPTTAKLETQADTQACVSEAQVEAPPADADNHMDMEAYIKSMKEEVMKDDPMLAPIPDVAEAPTPSTALVTLGGAAPAA